MSNRDLNIDHNNRDNLGLLDYGTNHEVMLDKNNVVKEINVNLGNAHTQLTKLHRGERCLSRKSHKRMSVLPS